jgi:hypothetical protein
MATLAFANPEADSITKGSTAASQGAPADAILVRTSKDGKKAFFKTTKKLSPNDLAAELEKASAGKKSSLVAVNQKSLTTKDPKNPEAEGRVEQQSWCGGRPYGYVNYWTGYWPCNYYYNYVPYYYGGCYGYYNYTWGVYW